MNKSLELTFLNHPVHSSGNSQQSTHWRSHHTSDKRVASVSCHSCALWQSCWKMSSRES